MVTMVTGKTKVGIQLYKKTIQSITWQEKHQTSWHSAHFTCRPYFLTLLTSFDAFGRNASSLVMLLHLGQVLRCGSRLASTRNWSNFIFKLSSSLWRMSNLDISVLQSGFIQRIWEEKAYFEFSERIRYKSWKIYTGIYNTNILTINCIVCFYAC